MGSQQVERIEYRLQKFRRQQLRLIQHDHTVDEIMQLAATTGAGGEQRLKQLDIGGHDQRCIPVLCRQTATRSFAVYIKVAMVFHDIIFAEDAAKHISGLLDDAGVGNGVDDAPLCVILRVMIGMFQREGQTGKCLAATGGHGKRKHAGRQRSLFAALRQHVGAYTVDWCIGRLINYQLSNLCFH